MTALLRSLRFRLSVGAALWIAIALAVAWVALGDLFQRHVEREFVVALSRHLDQLVASLEDAAGAGTSDSDTVTPALSRLMSDPRFRMPYSGLYWQVATADEVLLRSRSLWDTELALPADDVLDGQVHQHLIDGPQGQRLVALERAVTLPSSRLRFRAVVAADKGRVVEVVATFNRTLALSLLILGLGLVAAAVAQVQVGLRPLRFIRRSLGAIRSGRAKRLSGAFPTEVKPLVDDLNALLDHDAEVLERARIQTGNLAHGLKTPLSVLSGEARALAEAGNPAGPRISEQIERMRRQIDYQLARARIAAASDLLGARAEIRPSVVGLIEVLRRVHGEKGLELTANVPADLAFRGERQDLEEMLGNLMDNACKWAARRVRIEADGLSADRLAITVDDDGPGLDPAERKAAFDRGRRLDEGVAGSGLGLAIVRDLAELYGGSIALEEAPTGGLRARLVLPRA